MRIILIKFLPIILYLSIANTVADEINDDIDSKLLAGEWVVLTGTNEMDDVDYIGIGKASNNYVRNKKPALLGLGCQDKKLAIFIDLMTYPDPELGKYNEYTVRIRIDGEKPKKKIWYQGTNPRIVASKKPKKLIKKMNNANEMKFEFTEHVAGKKVLVFDLSGAGPFLKQVADACNI